MILALAWEWWAGLADGLLTYALGRVAQARDLLRKTTVIMYDLEPGAQASFEALHSAFADLASSALTGT